MGRLFFSDVFLPLAAKRVSEGFRKNPFEISHPMVILSLTDLEEGRYCTSAKVALSGLGRWGARAISAAPIIGSWAARKREKKATSALHIKVPNADPMGPSIKTKEYARGAEGRGERRM